MKVSGYKSRTSDSALGLIILGRDPKVIERLKEVDWITLSQRTRECYGGPTGLWVEVSWVADMDWT